MSTINIDKLKEQYPTRLQPSLTKTVLAYVSGGILLILGLLGLLAETITTLAPHLRPGSAPSLFSILFSSGFVIAGYRLLMLAPRFNESPTTTPFALECQQVYNEITQGDLAHKDDAQFADCEKYSLDELFDIYRSMNRSANRARFGTIAFLIIEKLK